MKKHCPLCNSEIWNYDIIVNLSGLCFCGDCWNDVKQQAYQLGWVPMQAMTQKIYNKALNNAKKLRV